MKKLVSLFLWFCAATFIAQCCIVGLSAVKGNFDRNTIVRIIALLNGIDIQAERLKGALVSAKSTPIPTYEDVLKAKVQASLDMDSKSDSLARWEDQLQKLEAQLRGDIERFDKRRADFALEKEKLITGAKNDSLKEMQKIIEVLSPEAAKDQLLMMLENGQKADVVAIIKGMPPDKQKKVLAEFNAGDDAQKLAEVLKELRSGEPLKSLIEGANKADGQP